MVNWWKRLIRRVPEIPTPLYGQSPVEVVSYIVYKEKNTTYVKNGTTGQLEYLSTNDVLAINYALSNLRPNRTWIERVVLIGEFLIDNSNSPLNIPSYTQFELYGRLIAKVFNKTLLQVVNAKNVVIRGGVYDGNSNGAIGGDVPVRVIHVENSENVFIENIEVLNGYGRGIEIDYPYNVVVRDASVHDNCRNIMVWVNPLDLANFNGYARVEGVRTYNVLYDNAIDATIKRLSISETWVNGIISVDGFEDLLIRGVQGNATIILTGGSWTGNYATKAIISDSTLTGDRAGISVNVFDINIGDIEISNLIVDKAGASAGCGIAFYIAGSGTISNVIIDSTIVKNAPWSGIASWNESGSTGGILNMAISNTKAIDNSQRGFALYANTGYIQINNSEASGNDWRGFEISNVATLIMNDILARKSGKYSQDGPLSLSNINNLIIINAWLEYGGVGIELTNVENIYVENVRGDNPATTLTNSGVAIIPANSTSVVVSHGLATTPSKIYITPLRQPPGKLWVQNITSTSFEIATDTAPTSDLPVAWYAKV